MAILTNQPQGSDQTAYSVYVLSVNEFKYDTKQDVIQGSFLIRYGENKEKHFVVLNSEDGLTAMFKANDSFHNEDFSLEGENLAQKHTENQLTEKTLISELSMQAVKKEPKAEVTTHDSDASSSKESEEDTPDGNVLAAVSHSKGKGTGKGTGTYCQVKPMHFLRELTMENEELKEKLADAKHENTIQNKLVQDLQSQLSQYMTQDEMDKFGQDPFVVSKT